MSNNAQPPPGKQGQFQAVVAVVGGVISIVTTLSGALAGVPKLFVVAGLVAILTVGIIVWRAVRAKRRRPTRVEVIVGAVVVVALAVAVILIPVRNPAPLAGSGTGDGGTGNGDGGTRTSGPAGPSTPSTSDSSAAPTSAGPASPPTAGPVVPNNRQVNPGPTGGADGVAPVPAPGPGPSPDLGPTSIDDCYGQASWESSSTDRVFMLGNNGFLSVHGSRTGLQYLPRAAIGCNGVLSFQHDYGGQINFKEGSLIEAGTEPTRERCQGSEHYSSAKLAANAEEGHLCSITGDGDEWMVVRVVETADLPRTVALQLVGFFPK